MIHELVTKARSCRRFRENDRIPIETLRWLVDLARLAPSGSNLQPLKYMIAHTPEQTEAVFPLLAWAGYLTDWEGPVPGERPAAYVIMLGDTSIRKDGFDCDCGIAAQNIFLGAAEKGLGACMIGSIKRERLREVLNLAATYEILLVIALGERKEKAVIEPVLPDGDIKYWRDDSGVHHVPKRALDEILLK